MLAMAMAMAMALALLGVDDMSWKELLYDPTFYGGSAFLRLWSSCPAGRAGPGGSKSKVGEVQGGDGDGEPLKDECWMGPVDVVCAPDLQSVILGPRGACSSGNSGSIIYRPPNPIHRRQADDMHSEPYEVCGVRIESHAWIKRI